MSQYYGAGNSPSQDEDYDALFSGANQSKQNVSDTNSGGYDALFNESQVDAPDQNAYYPDQSQQLPQSEIGSFLGDAWEQAKALPQSMYDVLDVAGTNIHAKAAALGAAGLKAADIDPELQKQWVERSRSMSRYAKAKSEKMGVIGETASSLLEAAPVVAATMMTGGLAAVPASAALTGIDVASEAARRQAEKYGDVSPGRIADSLVGSGLTEAALDVGMSKLPFVRPAMAMAKGLTHSGVASGQAEGWTQYGAGDDLDAGGIAGATAAGVGFRGAMEGLKRSGIGEKVADALSHPSEILSGRDPTRLPIGDINKAGLKAVEESSNLVQNLGSSEGAVRTFAQDAGEGGNYLANATNRIINNPDVDSALSELDGLSEKIQQAPQLQDFILSKTVSNLHNKLGDAWIDRGLNFDTNDGRKANKILGKSEEDMINSMQRVYGVEVPWFSSTEKIKRGETTSSWLSQLKKRGDELYGDYSGTYKSMIAKVDQKIATVRGLVERGDIQEGTSNLPQLQGLKTMLSNLNREMFHNKLDSNVDESIRIYADNANRLAAQTGMTNELTGLLGKEFGFNPVADAEVVKMTRKSLEAMDPSFFRRTGGDEIKDVDKTADAIASAALSPTGIAGKLPFVPTYRSWRMKGHKAESQDFIKGVSQELARHPIEVTKTPDEKFDDALSTGDPVVASSAAEDALKAHGIEPIKAPTESVDEAAARVDAIVSPEPKIAPVAPEDVVTPQDLRTMLPPRGVDMPTEPTPEPTPAPEAPVDFTGRSEDLAPSIRPEPVVEPQPVVEPVVSEPTVPDRSITRRPDIPKEEVPVEEPAQPVVEEPVPAAEPVVETPREAPDLATKPKERTKAEPEPEVKEEPKAEQPEEKTMVPTKRPDLKEVLDSVKEASEVKLPISGRTHEQMRKARELSEIHKHIKEATDKLLARGKYTEQEVADIIDGSIQSNGGLEGLSNMGLKNFKKKFTVDRMEADYSKRVAEKAEKAKNATKRKLKSFEDFQENYRRRKEFKTEEAAKEREAEAAKSHETIRKYAESQGIPEADVSSVLKKLGVTDKDPVNPIRVRAELERIKTAREEAKKRKLKEEFEKAKTEAEISKLKSDLAEKIDNAEVELKEIGNALDSAEGTTRNTLVRRREELNNRLKSLKRAREDAEGIESSESIRRQIKSLEKKFKDSERNISDLEDQLKQIENVMKENGASDPEISDYLAKQFDVRRLPIESMDNARKNAASYAKKLREADAKSVNDEIKKAGDEIAEDLKNAESGAEVQGISEAISEQIAKLAKDPVFIRQHQEAVKMLRTIADAAKANPNIEAKRAEVFEKYFNILEEGMKRKSEGVPMKELVTPTQLMELREKFQDMLGIKDKGSAYVGRLWKDIATTLTGNPDFKFGKAKKAGVLSPQGLLTKGGRLKARTTKVNIDDYKL